MPETQAYSVNWTVEIAPEGDVSNDVTEITYTRESGNPNSVTVELDTSQRPHALEEQSDIRVVLSDNNATVEFNGVVDDVNDSDSEPLVTVDGRTPQGLLDDVSLVGNYSENNLWDVIDAVVDTGPSRVRELSFDAEGAKSQYGLFGGQTDFGTVDIIHSGAFNINQDEWNQHETVNDNRGKQVELRISTYMNDTRTIYTMDMTGKDAEGNTVKASLDLPPGDSALDAYGTDTIRLSLSGGNRRFAEINSVSTDIPDLTQIKTVQLGGSVYDFVDTSYSFTAADDKNLNSFLNRITNYIESLDDDGQSWEFVVDSVADEIIIRPEQDNDPSLYTFTEGDNVIRPVAKRNLDDVANYVQVSGAGSVNVYTWAYNGSFYTMWGRQNPFQRGVFPDDTSDKFTWKWKDSPGTNDIDQINLRATSVVDDQITGWYQGLSVSHETMDKAYRTSVSGTAPIAGIKDVKPGDKAEVFYPSRGIPQKVADNTYTVEKVEYSVTPQEAKTAVEFGTKRPTATEVIGNAAVNEIRERQRRSAGGATPTGFKPVPGDIVKKYDDGTVKVEAENGKTYDNVRVV